MTDIKIVVGANFGDEGKGLMTDYFSNQAIQNNKRCIVVLSNGGAQRGHTVDLLGGVSHMFRHFGAGTFAGADTYYPQQFIINPMEFNMEFEDLVNNYHIIPRAYSSRICMWSTPFDMMVNQIVEEDRDDKRHGSCGMGIWETVYRYSKCQNLFMSIFDFNSLPTERKTKILTELRDNYYINRLKEHNISSVPESWRSAFYSPGLIEHFLYDVKSFVSKVTAVTNDFLRSYDTVIFENGQGLLLDGNSEFYGNNTTPSNTTTQNAMSIISDVFKRKETNVELCYVTRTYMTRHGAGAFLTECDKSLINSDMNDKSNVFNPFQRELRYGQLYLPGLNLRLTNDVNRFNTLKYPTNVSVAVTHTNEAQIDLSKITAGQKIYTSDSPTRESVKIERV